MRERVSTRLSSLNIRERVIDLQAMAHGYHARSHCRGALPAGSAVHICAPSLAQPLADLLYGCLERGRWQLTEIGQAQAVLLDPGVRKRRLDGIPLARPILLVLDQVEQAIDFEPLEHGHVILVQRVGADEKALLDIGEAVGAKPGRHIDNDARWDETQR